MASFHTGAGYWKTASDKDVDALFLCDGPCGLRKQTGKTDYFGKYPSVPARLYPCPAAIGCTWDKDLSQQVGLEMAKDMQAQDVDLLLAPCIDHKRHPLAGRSFESYAEDPLLSARLASAFVNGIHAGGKACCLKHFVCNVQEDWRMSIDLAMDKKTLEHLYLPAFKQVIEEACPDALMMAYPKLNGTFCTEHKGLYRLARQWGFDGLFVSDWGSVNEPDASFEAGLDLEMPGNRDTRKASRPEWSKRARKKIQKLQAAREHKEPETADDAVLLEAAVQSIVCVKKGKALDGQAAVAGYYARHPKMQGSGSSLVHPVMETSLVSEWPDALYAKGYEPDGSTNEKLLAGALAAASVGDHVVVVVGTGADAEAEGQDRKSMAMPAGMNRLVDAMLALDKPLCIVVQAGAPVQLDWFDRLRPEDSVYIQYPGGQYSGKALSLVLHQKRAAGGFLSETWPLCVKDVPSYKWWHQNRHQAVVGEGCFSGYRYYDSFQVPVRFPFGFGVPGTEFEVKTEHGLHVTNVGSSGGYALLCKYRTQTKDPELPFAELADFEKRWLEPGQTCVLDWIGPDVAVDCCGRRVYEGPGRDQYEPAFPKVHPEPVVPDGWNRTVADLMGNVLVRWIRNGYAVFHPEAADLVEQLSLRQLVLAGVPRKWVKWIAGKV